MTEIKKASASDIPLIRELTFRIWPQTYSSILSPEQIDFMLEMMYSEASLLKQITEEGCQFIIVYDNNIPVGFASYGQIEIKTWKLHKIYILHDQQGKGLGKFVIDFDPGVTATLKPVFEDHVFVPAFWDVTSSNCSLVKAASK